MDRAILHRPWGPRAFEKWTLSPGEVLSFDPFAGLPRQHDGSTASTRLELLWSGTTCRVRSKDEESRLLLNGKAATEGELLPGQWLRIGDSTFLICKEGQPMPGDAGDPETAQHFARVLTTLRGAEGGLFAVLDAARDGRILQLLRESPEPTQSLYAGVKGDALAAVAPYLVQLDRDGWLLQTLVHMGWGQSWGIYIDCALPFAELRRHLRRFLKVQEEGRPDPLYFRFYDPRVLRVFVPTCTPEQLDALYGPIQTFWLEDAAAAPLALAHRSAGYAAPNEENELSQSA